jgi:hypothetical protein
MEVEIEESVYDRTGETEYGHNKYSSDNIFNREQHIVNIRRNRLYQTYTCRVCTERFSSKKARKKHMDNSHRY